MNIKKELKEIEDEAKLVEARKTLASKKLSMAETTIAAREAERKVAELPAVQVQAVTQPSEQTKKPRRGLKGWQKVGLACGITFGAQFYGIRFLTPLLTTMPAYSLYLWTAMVMLILVPGVLGTSLFIQGARAMHIPPPKITADQFLAFLKSDESISQGHVFDFLDAFREKARINGKHLKVEAVDAQENKNSMQIERGLN